MSDISTRIWLDERIWDRIRRRAEAEQTTIRELIPRLVSEFLDKPTTASAQMAPAAPTTTSSPSEATSESGVPVVALSDVYQCGVCGAQIRLGGLSNHLGRHQKEQQASEAERS